MNRDEMIFAPLSDQDLTKIQEAEKMVNQQGGKNDIILLAYAKK
ncbi:hypothetical protein [Dehalobacterium formicoaceticum]|uniref:Uncharacterized protein n=1 Tax=Dehalobacterium formicoaceticum TaxID=51515 RepID=A0ABT1Y1Z6_9FIRM|nr:hypothetical protein [Dehalobacterium formicoaceticum]MCR6544892.1 hypothetical protein [Dehalobacterium formicoaceticum]